ncbi:hypothetical protein OEA41_001764 [Lepraria neglecta]|uniref:Allergen n=1 Tax=Lepraria neglecta TaxID=209136 RepID=A0AAD9ZBA8_9LECA|nr:hypothetical protein OEA41_001764 [Lepraria neglecta]
MDKAKAAVSEFMHKAGHHDTTVHEKVAPAVVNENITKVRHEEAQTAIDREVHQDHYHTSVQPVKDREVLPEQHSHNIIPVEHREHQHGDAEAIKARLEQERLQFKNTRTQGATQESHSVAPVIAGEHVHHHVHETIQPVVNKETIQPSVVHTTVPIHEVHQNEAKHHAASALPAVSMADFKKQGGSLTGREERYDGFEGEPRAVGGALGGSTGTTGTTGHHGHHGHHTGTTGTTGTDYDNTTGRHGHHTGTTENTGTGYDNTTGRHGHHTGTTGTTGTGYDNTTGTTTKKPGLMDKLNPRKDADGDGKAGLGD